MPPIVGPVSAAPKLKQTKQTNHTNSAVFSKRGSTLNSFEPFVRSVNYPLLLSFAIGQAAQQSKIVFAQTTMSAIHEHAEERAILILYATETGNSLDAAERIAREARRWHFHTRLASTDAYPLVSRVPGDHLMSTFNPPSCLRKT